MTLSLHEYQKLTGPANKLSSTLLMPILEESEDKLFERNPDKGHYVIYQYMVYYLHHDMDCLPDQKAA